ncbi:zf-HC2 domain-containing protein [Anaerobacillus sp. MEB173]|uniref:zf-HC2 domain-containing protein n=1 Tax=Anaerobacillus sp. MEB173 TaxID=3383345 RepID=UPI003F8E1DF4
MGCEQKMIALIHKYLDGETSEQERKQLYDHLDHCEECNTHLNQLKKSIAFIQSASHIEAPSNFTESLMGKLPKQKKGPKWKKWMKNHPMLVAASFFVLLMAASVFSVWSDNQQELTVTGHANLQIDKERGAVIVPSGEVVEGDLVIKNGVLEIEGEVKGNVTIINGEQYLASTGTVSGDIKEINQVLEWVWYHIKDFFVDVFSIFNGE